LIPRRVLPLLLVAAAPVQARGEFPASQEVGGQHLVLNGSGSRHYSIFQVEVYRAAL